MADEEGITFDCQGVALAGVLHHARADQGLAVVMVVGGPQYRVGSHRLYVKLARHLVAVGVSVLRFDCRGMGDSDGQSSSFANVGADIESALAYCAHRKPNARLLLFGLCDGASACAMLGGTAHRVLGMILLNPWVRTDSSEGHAMLSNYYPKRLAQIEFWRRLVSGGVQVLPAVRSLLDAVWSATRCSHKQLRSADSHFIERMRSGLDRFQGKVVIALSEDDLVAAESRRLFATSPAWAKLLRTGRFTIVDLHGADHTLSSDAGVSQFIAAIRLWLRDTKGSSYHVR